MDDNVVLSSVTLREVANEAGVHVSTASRALNPETRSIVNEKTARRVAAAAERLGYRPHPLARGLRTNRTLTVGITVPDLLNPVFPLLYAGAETSLRDQGYSLLVGAGDDPANPVAASGILIDRHVDGLIMANAHIHSSLPQMASNQPVPTVLVNRTTDSIDAPSIACDDHAGIGLIVRHLVELGHTDIAHIAGPQDISNGVIRKQAFVAWMHSEGLDTPPELIVETNGFHTAEGRKACKRLLDSGARFTAIVGANDLIALGCYDTLAERKIKVPADISVTGFDDMAFIDRVNPPMTTVLVPFYEMGALAGQVMLSLLTSDDSGAGTLPTSTRLRPVLKTRGSTAPPAGS
ncbi:MAG: LacI family DNA-binding transcriptional regulator [Acidimicrobiia bacterium]|nr:LacI family DNA-binding transcriptional regulator [Acidimicrobiia bacterium]